MEFFYGVLLGVLILLLVWWLRRQKIGVKWYEWLVAGVGLLLMIFGWQNFVATRAEHWNPDTPITFLLVFGLTGLVLVGLANGLVIWRWYRGRKKVTAQSS